MTTATIKHNLMDTLPEDVEDIIYRYKHEMQFSEVLKQINCINILACKHHNIIFWDAVEKSNNFTWSDK